MDASEPRITYIDVYNWGDEGQFYFAPGHHGEADFRAAVARSNRNMGVTGDESIDDAVAEEEIQHIWIRYTMPAEPAALGSYVDCPLDSEQVCFEYAEADTPGAFPATLMDVS